MKICVRVDDFGLKPFAEGTDFGLELGRKFHRAMRGKPFLAAVIPARLDEEAKGWLRSKPEGLTVAMHGYKHEAAGENVESEFAGRGPEECCAMINKAKRLLGTPTRHFVAPWNHYGSFLHGALVDNGLTVHWVGNSEEPFPPPPQKLNGRWLVPSWKPLSGCLRWPSGESTTPLSSSMPELMRMNARCVLNLHLTWEAVRGDDFEGLSWLVANYGDVIVSPEEHLR